MRGGAVWLPGRPIRAGHVGFVLAPRRTAAGRIGDATEGLGLLLTDDPGEATATARRLDALNAERQLIDQRILDQALEHAQQTGDIGQVQAGGRFVE